MERRELESMKDIVENILSENIAARNSDNYLYYLVLKRVAADKGVDIDTMTVPTFLNHMKLYGLPGFETVRRSRQKLQAEQPELSAVSTVAIDRNANEMIFKAFARS